MRSRWTISWIFILLIGAGFLTWQFVLRGEKPYQPPPGESTTELPEGEKVEISQEEIARWVQRFKNGSEPWRSNVVEVVKRERERLGVPAEAEIRERGEYVRRADGTVRTLVFALASGLDFGHQKTVMLEEHPSGIWVPLEVGPFFVLVGETGQ